MSEYNSDYDVRLATLGKMGGDTGVCYDSVYSIDLAILDKTGGGGGGSASAEKMTQQEYDEAKAAGTLKADTIYIITDAPAIDMDDYYTKDEVDSTIAEDIEGKADAASVTASNGWCAWNEQGIVTGKTYDLYRNQNNINGTYRYSVQTNNNSYTIYAPTSVGTNGQVLQSTGSGAPSWVNGVTTTVSGGVKVVQISESEYEALTTKDANTLYLLIEG